MSGIQRGAIMRLRNFDHYPDPTLDTGILREGFVANKDRKHPLVFVVIVLGTEPKDGTDPLDVVACLEAMGWTPPPELEARSAP